ncbi:hypothetical protein LIPSTDRAFT_270045 [Lipomyces starkeyi NRRL Y-11557]|uniref:Uncharacterized protein n=1 Tax=Lipomyces starkeyi NRRL Y-11557 TaxID=675824 RepID=A0A1E3Q806_LIPST|nr:hypothetical protein LIPSTDRAFT_270045 [Lipomyces starkeyi NRRL Y-11557]
MLRGAARGAAYIPLPAIVRAHCLTATKGFHICTWLTRHDHAWQISRRVGSPSDQFPQKRFFSGVWPHVVHSCSHWTSSLVFASNTQPICNWHSIMVPIAI